MSDPECRSVYLGFMIDANRINSRQADDDMNRLEQWHDNGVIEMLMSEPAYDEARAGADGRRARKTLRHIYSMTMATSPDEQEELRQIGNILFPSGTRDANQRNDVEIVFNAKKYMRILVTSDGASKRQPAGILGNRDALRAIGVRVMTSAEAVALVEQRISERDTRARYRANQEGAPLPEWVGRD